MLTRPSHQLTALTMMMEKECGVVENAQFPSLWGLSTNFKSALQSVAAPLHENDLRGPYSDIKSTDTAIKLRVHARASRCLSTAEYLLTLVS